MALSTIEVEYVTMTKGVKEAIWLQGLFEELTSSWESMVCVFRQLECYSFVYISDVS